MKSLWRAFGRGMTTTIVLGFVVGTPYHEAQAQTFHSLDNTAYPSVIRVAIRADNNPVGPIQYVQTIGFKEYCEDVLPNEWMPSWSPDALRAGAVAVKMFAWYHTLHPVTKDGFTYDVDNTTNYQEFKYLTGRAVTDRAVKDTWKEVFVPSNGEIQKLDYRAGVPNNANWPFVGSEKMAQWGSQYWGLIAKMKYPDILNLFYPGRVIKYV